MTVEQRLYRLSVIANQNRLLTAIVPLLFGVVIGLVGALLGGAEGLALAETCYGVALACAIFAWSLAGISARAASVQVAGAEGLAATVAKSSVGFGDYELDDWHREALAGWLALPEGAVEEYLLLYLREKSGKQGSRELVAITKNFDFVRLVGRGKGGRQVIDLATGAALYKL